MIIALEGIDASGKNTQSRKLVQRFLDAGFDSERFDFPHYEAETGQYILGLLKRDWKAVRSVERAVFRVNVDNLSEDQLSEVLDRAKAAYFEGKDAVPVYRDGEVSVHNLTAIEDDDPAIAFVLQALMTVNQYEHYSKLTEWTSPKGVLVLDRYYGSGIAYGEADGLDGGYLREVHRALPCPDLWVFLDVSPDASVQRRPERRDEYEKRSGFMEKVRDRYLTFFREGADKDLPFVVVDGMGSEEDVHARIWGAVESHVLPRLVEA